NHYWDCEYLTLVAAYVLGVKTWARPQQTTTTGGSQQASMDQAENPFTGGQSLFGGGEN
ncbi:MAG: hypothetical protein ACYDIB_07380, partial [Desulfobulbia bacterium]